MLRGLLLAVVQEPVSDLLKMSTSNIDCEVLRSELPACQELPASIQSCSAPCAVSHRPNRTALLHVTERGRGDRGQAADLASGQPPSIVGPPAARDLGVRAVNPP